VADAVMSLLLRVAPSLESVCRYLCIIEADGGREFSLLLVLNCLLVLYPGLPC
jgi:hypothetical protein